MSVGRERAYFDMPRDGEGRKIAVIGAGPAGLTAAETLARRGFDVTVYEKEKRPGGQVTTAALCPDRDKLAWCVTDLMTAAEKAGAKIVLGTALSAEEIAALEPWAVVLATGAEPVRPRSIQGVDRENVFAAPDIIRGRVVIRDADVVVAGSGLTGLETAEILSDMDNRVTVIEMADTLAPGAWFQIVDDEMDRLKETDTTFLTGTKLLSVEDGGVTVEEVKSGTNRKIPADVLVLALGVRPDKALLEQLKALHVERVYSVGDAVKSGTIADACHSAFDTVMTIQ